MKLIAGMVIGLMIGMGIFAAELRVIGAQQSKMPAAMLYESEFARLAVREQRVYLRGVNDGAVSVASVPLANLTKGVENEDSLTAISMMLVCLAVHPTDELIAVEQKHIGANPKLAASQHAVGALAEYCQVSNWPY